MSGKTIEQLHYADEAAKSGITDPLQPSATPETDRTLHGIWFRGDHGSALVAKCRELEIQRNEARAEAEKLKQEVKP
jgi:hypothetical protein